jgi:hypothetical protein
MGGDVMIILRRISMRFMSPSSSGPDGIEASSKGRKAETQHFQLTTPGTPRRVLL